MELDDRIVEVGIEYNGQMKFYRDLAIYATGTKYANSIQNECHVKLFNLDKSTQDSICTQTTPYNLNRTRKRIVINAGRKSYGMSRVYSGNIFSASPSEPPDIAVEIRALTGNFDKGNIVFRTQPSLTQFSKVAAGIAQDLNMPLVFEAAEKQISNYNFSGPALSQVAQLGEMGMVDAFIDDETLFVKDANVPLKGAVRVINVDSGMVGIPQPTEFGIQIKYLLDNTSRLGGLLRVESKIYPIIDGSYSIYKLSFDIASRDTPFYWIAEARKIQ